MASKHFNRIVQDRLNNVLMGKNLICQGEGLYLIMDREGDDARAMEHYAATKEAKAAIPANDLNNI